MRLIVVAVVLGLWALAAAAEEMHEERAQMGDPNVGKLGREWVEIAEEGGQGRIVLRPFDAPIPPRRGGRKRLSLAGSGGAEGFAQGAADAMESTGTGQWSLEGQVLQLDIEGWRGSYRIEELTDDVLILDRQ